MIVVIALIALLAMFAMLLFLLYRNQRLYKYRMDLIDKTSYAAQDDIANGREWLWRYDECRSVNYNKMLFTFWRSFDSFYKDKGFTELV